MTFAEYARHQKVNRSSVLKWKRAGYLTITTDGLVNVERSDERLLQAGRGKRLSGIPTESTPAATKENIQALQTLLENAGMVSESEARRVKENYIALLRQLEFEIRSGKLIEAEPLRKSLFEIWRRERDSLLRLPSRIGAVLAAKFKVDQNEMTIELEKVITEYLAERSEEPLISGGA